MYTLGINASFHDSSACIIQDGKLLAAAEEERFTHVKHGKRPIPFSTYELPFHAIDYCLSEAGIRLSDVDHVAYSYDADLLLGAHRNGAHISIPLEQANLPPSTEWESPWDPLFLSAIVNAPRHLVDGFPHHLQARFRSAKVDGHFKWHFVNHHVAHAASAFQAAPFQRSAVLTLDGRGEKATTTYGLADGNHYEVIGQVDMPHSLGLLYEQVTSYLGFLHSSDEYKVMALASFGKPEFVKQFQESIHIGKEGDYAIDQIDFEKVFGPPRQKGDEFSKHHFNIAH